MNVKEIFKNLLDNSIIKVNSQDKHTWNKGNFNEIRKLQADKRGELGELFIVEILKLLNFNVQQKAE